MAAVVDEIRHCLIVSGRRGGLLVVVTGRQTDRSGSAGGLPVPALQVIGPEPEPQKKQVRSAQW